MPLKHRRRCTSLVNLRDGFKSHWRLMEKQECPVCGKKLAVDDNNSITCPKCKTKTYFGKK